jgi:excisionase family DNA binding protein
MPSSTVKGEDEGEPQAWFTPTEAARYLRVSRQTVYAYMEQGLLRYYELASGGGRRLRRADLDALLKPAPGGNASTGEASSSD